MVKKTYKELLEGLKYSDLGYTGERKPLTDPKYKQFTDTINKNTVIANTHIDSSLPPQMPQAQVSGQGNNPWAKNRRNAVIQDTKGAEVSTVGGTSPATVPTTQPETAPTTDTPLTIDAKYSDFVNWAKQNGVDSDKVFQDAMALARTQYEQSRATYGLQAEQLAQAGLTNSGVSDNLERAAYAQKVQAEQAALGQKAALDQANKQGFAEYQEQQKQQQQQYTNLYQQLVDGYEDEYGNIHAGVSPEMAIAQLKFAGLTDETMIAEAQKAYGAYKQVYDQQQADQQNAIAGTVTNDEGNVTFDPNSMFAKLFAGTMTSEEFLDTVAKDYGIQAATDEEAVGALLDKGAITGEYASMYYREAYKNTIEAIAQSGLTGKDLLKEADSDLYTTVKKAKEAYEQGKMSKKDWDEFRKGIMSGDSAISISMSYNPSGPDSPSDEINFELIVGDSVYSIGIDNGKGKRVNVSEARKKTLDGLANGMNIVMYNDKLYIKAGTGAANSATWIEVGAVAGTRKKSMIQLLKTLAEK